MRELAQTSVQAVWTGKDQMLSPRKCKNQHVNCLETRRTRSWGRAFTQAV